MCGFWYYPLLACESHQVRHGIQTVPCYTSLSVFFFLRRILITFSKSFHRLEDEAMRQQDLSIEEDRKAEHDFTKPSQAFGNFSERPQQLVPSHLQQSNST